MSFLILTDDTLLNDISLDDDPKLADFARTIKPDTVLAFATGASRIPAGGFQPNGGRITFDHHEKLFPRGITCNNELVFSAVPPLPTFQEFATHLARALYEGWNKFSML